MEVEMVDEESQPQVAVTEEDYLVIKSADPSDLTTATFVIKGEDHTLGNLARYMLNQNSEVIFSGYSIPHPSDPFMHLRVQTAPKSNAKLALIKSLGSMKEALSIVNEKFQAATLSYDFKQM